MPPTKSEAARAVIAAEVVIPPMGGKTPVCSDAEAVAKVEATADQRIATGKAWQDYIATAGWSPQRIADFMGSGLF